MDASAAPTTPPGPHGDTRARTEVVSRAGAEALAHLLDIDLPTGGPTGGELPPMWHWTQVLPRPRTADLGHDGHEAHGVPAPPGPGRRRMFAGGRVHTLRPLRLDEPATRRWWVSRTADKTGRTGPLTFTTIRHEISQRGEPAIVEEQDIVYRAAGGGPLPDPPEQGAPARSPRLDLDVDEALLFRFSALTYNGHRIHYDREFCRADGYADLVIHGPLQALLMAELARRHGVELTGRVFAYRLLAPAIGPQRLTVLPGGAGIGEGAEVYSAGGVRTALATIDAPADATTGSD